jgi:transcriptional regulator with XRE-family HTH domain
VTQLQLAEALGGSGKRSVSVPLISSWESRTSPKPPPLARLEDYATFFATPRSFDGHAGCLLSIEELTDDELVARQELLQDLTRLRDAVQGAPRASAATVTAGQGLTQSLDAGPYRFTENQDITIVCAQLPSEWLDRMPYTDPLDPDFIALYRYSELDSLFELYGHLRAANPTTQVNLRLAHELQSDDYSSHLISLGGVDWNLATSSVLDRLDLPVRQSNEWKKPGGAYFEVEDKDGEKLAYRPLLVEPSGRPILREDVALFARAVNPFNRKRSVTICTGMYGSGTVGAVRALTDVRFRDRNAEYLRERFADGDTYCILSRVTVVAGKALTPDWTVPDTRLFEWSRP